MCSIKFVEKIKEFFSRLFGKKQIELPDCFRSDILKQLDIVEAKFIDNLSQLTFSEFSTDPDMELLTELKTRLDPFKDLNQDNQKLNFYINKAIDEPIYSKNTVKAKISVDKIIEILAELKKIRSLVLHIDVENYKDIFQSPPKLERKIMISRAKNGVRKINKQGINHDEKWLSFKEEFKKSMEKSRGTSDSDPNRFDDMKEVLNKIVAYSEEKENGNG